MFTISWAAVFRYTVSGLFTVTFISQVHLLYKCLFNKVGERLSAPILINMLLWCIESGIGALLFGSVTFLNWSYLPDIFKSFLALLGNPVSSLTSTISASVIFLLIDRIFILTTPISHQKYKNRFAALMIFACILVSTGVMTAQSVSSFYQRQNMTGKYLQC